MNKRLLAGIVATFLLASPLLASARVVGTGGDPASSQQLIALYTQLIHLLEEEIGTLVATHGGATPLANIPPTPASSNFSHSSTTGTSTNPIAQRLPLSATTPTCPAPPGLTCVPGTSIIQ